MARRLAVLTLALTATACGGGGTLRDGTFRDAEASYRLGALPDSWERVAFSDNDLAWTDGAGRVIAVNALCDGHGDPSLKVLTDHLLLGFEEREILEREQMEIAGRGALRTRANARLDGVPVEMELTLLKKGGCVYDLIYTAPPGTFGVRAADYRALVQGFSTDADARQP
ncbi:hypothetical protein [Vulgatibacter sp.]|uniref:hypothetical protein n=1 Tax=Vulgatibacter sp. TaxID=1971226 RepID=UPI003569E016